jgi:hypothetical protein
MIEIARHCASIEELDISDCVKITDKSLIQIANNCTNLHSLNITCLKITDVSMSAISQNCTALTCLRAIECKLVTGSHIHHLSLLEECDLGWCPGVTSDNVISIVRNCKNLKLLHLCRTWITDDCIIEIAHNSINLEDFNIHSCDNLTDENLCELVRCCINLQRLDINTCHNITDEGLIELAKRQQNLKSINIADCSKVTDIGIFGLAFNIPTLEVLDITNCNYTAVYSLIERFYPGIDIIDYNQ